MRGFAGILLAVALALSGAARAEGPVCVCAGGVACLAGEGGETLLEGFEDAFVVRQGALYAAGSRGDYRLYDAAGNALGDTPFAMIDDAQGCLIFRQGGLYGAMDDAGNVVLPARWTQLVPCGADGFLALDTDPLDETPDALLRLDADGEATPTGAQTLCALAPLESGRMVVRGANGRFGAVDGRGRQVIDAVWRGLSAFEGGFAVASGDGGVGLIDVNGVEVIPATYDWLARGDGIVAALDGEGLDVYSADGASRLYRVEGERLEVAVAGNCALVKDGETSRLYGADGATLGQFGPAFSCAPGLNGQLIAREGEWGEACAWVMNPDGSAASERYQHIVPLAGGRYAFGAMKGIQYHSAELDRDKTSWDYDSLRFGLMDDAGAELLPAQYRQIRAAGEDRLLLVGDGAVALADMNGVALRVWVTAEGEAPTGE